jgi:acyl-CoA reductase-like NAD-dependent aldehyde dehydrogenase
MPNASDLRISRAHIVACRVTAGRVWINTYGEADPVMTFGECRQSGLGREFGAESIDAYTQSETVLDPF